MNLNLYIGQSLWATNGESVTICEIAENKFCVRYKGQKIWREKSILNNRLFFSKHEAMLGHAVNEVISYASNKPPEDSWSNHNVEEVRSYTSNQAPKNSCNNCMLMKREDCFGDKKICEYYQHVPYVSKEEIDSWPTECMGAYEHYYKSWKK